MKEKLSQFAKKHWPEIILALIVVLAIILRARFFLGIERIDSLKYSQVVYNLLQGHFFGKFLMEAQDRITFLFPTAIFYKLWGVNEVTSVAWIFLCNIAGVVVIYALGRLINVWTGIIAALLAAFYPLEVSTGTRMLPDGLNLLFVGLPIYLFFLGEIKFPKKAVWFYLLAGVGWGLSYYVKINLLVVFPIFMLVYIVYRRRFNVKYLCTILGFALVWLSACLYFYLNTGIFFLQEYQNLYINKYSYSAFEKLNGYVSNLKPPTNSPVSPQLISGEATNPGLLRRYFEYTAYFINLIKHNQGIKYFLSADLVSLLVLIISPRRKQYWIVYILLISSAVYLLATNTFAWNNRYRYLTVLSVPVLLTIAAAMGELLIYSKKYIASALITIVLIIGFIFSVKTANEAYFHHHNQTGKAAGRFVEAKLVLEKVDLRNFKGKIVTPPGKWPRAINYYLGYDTGYDYFNPDSYNNDKLRDYAHAGAKYDKDSKLYYFDENNDFIKADTVIIKNSQLKNVDNFEQIYNNPRLDFEVLKSKP